ncbi:major facilitator superfamily protein [Escherichia coli]|uniref:Major facilitator superfamily protein n=1 Tax=Escherichia coli TaxID=562 RepID=A0A376YK45_ECOLX|nr:major facilitator superfamily protein [Escherichia coli]
MSDKKKRSMAGLPWIAAMAFFMQALDATILNTALPAIAHSLNRSPRDAISHHQLYADGGDAYSGKRMASRSLRYASHFYPCRESVHIGFSGLRTF